MITMERQIFAVAVLVVVAGGLTGAVASCAAFKPIARTVDDVATIACRQQLFGQAQAQGISVEDVCRTKAVLQPFIDAILSTSQGIGMKYGAKLPVGD